MLLLTGLMLRRTLVVLVFFTLALGVLSISLLNSASPNYAFGKVLTPSPTPENAKVTVDYFLPYAGRIAPDHPLWPLKALRDKLWLMVTTNPTKKAEVMLLLADKRIALAQELMGEGNAELSVSTLTKAEKYLESAIAQEQLAQAKGADTASLHMKLSLATLKHRQIEEEILAIAPEDAKPVIVQTIDLTKKLFEITRVEFTKEGRKPVDSPFKD